MSHRFPNTRHGGRVCEGMDMSERPWSCVCRLHLMSRRDRQSHDNAFSTKTKFQESYETFGKFALSHLSTVPE